MADQTVQYQDMVLDTLKSKSVLATDVNGKIIAGTPTDLSGYVPYTGATTNLDLGIRTLTTTGVATIGSNANAIQLTIKNNSSQSKTNPTFRITKSDGTALFDINAFDNTSVLIGLNVGRVISAANPYSVIVGAGAGYSLTSGGESVFLGYQAGYYSTTASYNTFIGSQAGQGTAAGTGTQNTFVGQVAGLKIKNGNYNTGIGKSSLAALTDGGSNAMLGTSSGAALTTGSYNVGVGKDALKALVDGGYNTMIGMSAGLSMTSGNYNSGFGYYALNAITTGETNCGVGYQAMNLLQGGSNNASLGYISLASNVSGSNNTAMGYRSGYTNTGSGSVFLGANAGYHETGSNVLFIDNVTRTNEADGRAKALVYGIFASTVAAQSLTVNGTVIAPFFQTSTAITANSTGTVAIVAKDASLLTANAGWMPFKKSDGTTVYIPYWA